MSDGLPPDHHEQESPFAEGDHATPRSARCHKATGAMSDGLPPDHHEQESPSAEYYCAAAQHSSAAGAMSHSLLHDHRRQDTPLTEGDDATATRHKAVDVAAGLSRYHKPETPFAEDN